MPNTAHGLPYPVATDPLAGGAAAIEALARAVDSQSLTTYRKNTAKAVVNTVTETDLLNGEITLAAGVLGTDRVVRLAAAGDLFNNSGANPSTPRFKVKLGASTLFDTGVVVGAWQTIPTVKRPWKADITISEMGANSQSVALNMDLYIDSAGSVSPVIFTTGEGAYGPIHPQVPFYKAIGWTSAAELTAGALALVFSVILPTANASVGVTLKTALVEII